MRPGQQVLSQKLALLILGNIAQIKPLRKNISELIFFSSTECRSNRRLLSKRIFIIFYLLYYLIVRFL